MAQTPALFFRDGETIDYTFSADAAAGDVIVLGTVPMIVPVAVDISENTLGKLVMGGVWKVPQAAEAGCDRNRVWQ